MSSVLEFIKLSFFVLLVEKPAISNEIHTALQNEKNVFDAVKLDIIKRNAGGTTRGHAVMTMPIVKI